MSLHHSSDPLCPLCESKLTQAHPSLVQWCRGVKAQYPNAHVSWAFRDEADQDQALAEGKTKLVWPNSAHNKTPAMALDLFQIDANGLGVWSPQFFVSLANTLPNTMKWGGRWKDLGDDDHFELISTPE